MTDSPKTSGETLNDPADQSLSANARPHAGSADDATTVQELRQIMGTFVQERDWTHFHHPKNLALALTAEVGELLEHFQWLTDDQSRQLVHDRDAKHEIAEELSDCFSYLLSLANCLQIDVSQSLRLKMAKNRLKYPVGHSGRKRPVSGQESREKNDVDRH